MESVMNPRRITLAVGTAAGGLLAAAFLPIAVAFADNFAFQPDPNTPETALDGGGIPFFYDDVGGLKLWDVVDTSQLTATGTPEVVGSFETLQDHWATWFGTSNLQIFVTSDVPDSMGNISAQDPTVNSVFDWTYFDSGHDFYNFYSDIAGTGGAANTVTDTLVTPFGDIDLTPIVGGFDASHLFEFG